MSRPAASGSAGLAAVLSERLRTRTATVGVIGLGYVGLPMATLLATKGFRVLGFDTDRTGSTC